MKSIDESIINVVSLSSVAPTTAPPEMNSAWSKSGVSPPDIGSTSWVTSNSTSDAVVTLGLYPIIYANV